MLLLIFKVFDKKKILVEVCIRSLWFVVRTKKVKGIAFDFKLSNLLESGSVLTICWNFHG